MKNDLKIQYWAIDRLRHFAGNARKHDEHNVAEIAASISRFGFVNPVLVDADGEIIAGHGRALAAAYLKLDKVPVIVLANLGEAERRALRLADNRIAEKSTWDTEAVQAELRALKELDASTDGLGWSDAELDALLREAVNILPDDPYEPPQRTIMGERSTENDGSDDSEADNKPLRPSEPKSSDDDYSMFELVMLHENKIRLVEKLSEIRAEHLYDKLEDALMHLLRYYDGETDA